MIGCLLLYRGNTAQPKIQRKGWNAFFPSFLKAETVGIKPVRFPYGNCNKEIVVSLRKAVWFTCLCFSNPSNQFRVDGWWKVIDEACLNWKLWNDASADARSSRCLIDVIYWWDTGRTPQTHGGRVTFWCRRVRFIERSRSLDWMLK